MGVMDFVGQEFVEKIKKIIGNADNQFLEPTGLQEGLSLLNGLSLSQLHNCREQLQLSGYWNPAAHSLFLDAEMLFSTEEDESVMHSEHPLNILNEENQAIMELIANALEPKIKQMNIYEEPGLRESILQDVKTLNQIDAHYKRIENLLFPYLEREGFVAPAKVMWAMHDDARRMIKDLVDALENPSSTADEICHFTEYLMGLIKTAIKREEETILNSTRFSLSHDEWAIIAEESDQIGYCMVHPLKKWEPENIYAHKTLERPLGKIELGTGILSIDQLKAILDVLPMELTFVDETDTVCYFSKSAQRIVPRQKTVLGRSIYNCHPTAYNHTIEMLIMDLKSGKKNKAFFEYKKDEGTIVVNYYALRTADGVYMGLLEWVENKG